MQNQITVFFLSMMAFNVSAAEYSVQPILGITSEIDDNKRLLVDESLVKTTVGLRTLAEVKLLMLSEDTRLYITPIIGVNRYSEEIGLNTERVNLNVDLIHSLAERHQFGLAGNFSIEPITVQSTVIDPVSLSAAGLTFEEIEQESLFVSPSYTYFFNDRFNLRGSFSYTDTKYDTTTNNFFDFQYYRYDLEAKYSLSETDAISTNVYRTEYISNFPSEFINNAFQVTYSKDISETLKASAGLGLTFGDSETTFQTQFGPIVRSSSAVGELISLSLEKDFEYARFVSSFSRRVTPTSQGTEQVRDNLNIRLTQRFAERLSGSLSLNYSEFTNGNSNGNSGNEYFTFNSSMNYTLSPNWNITGGYRYRELEDIGINNKRDSNNIFVTIRYVADKIIFN